MRVVVPVVLSAVVGGLISLGVVVGVTSVSAQDARPEVTETLDPADARLGDVTYGSR